MRFADMSTRRLKRAYIWHIKKAWLWEGMEKGLGRDYMKGAEEARDILAKRGVWTP